MKKKLNICNSWNSFQSISVTDAIRNFRLLSTWWIVTFVYWSHFLYFYIEWKDAQNFIVALVVSRQSKKRVREAKILLKIMEDKLVLAQFRTLIRMGTVLVTFNNFNLLIYTFFLNIQQELTSTMYLSVMNFWAASSKPGRIKSTVL